MIFVSCVQIPRCSVEMTVDTDTRVAAAWTWTLAPRLWSLRSNGRRGGGGGGSPDLYHDQTGTYDKLFYPHSTYTHTDTCFNSNAFKCGYYI